MLARKQTNVQTAEVAISQLQVEARYFDQLTSQFPVYKRSLGKHALDCRQVATNIQKKLKNDSPEVISTSVRTANVFLTEGRRLRLKLRISLLQQEATGLELEASRWSALETVFKTLAEECRQLVSACQTNISIGSSLEVEESLARATALYEKSLKLRKQQKQERREDASTRLYQKVELLKVEADQLQEKIKTYPSLSGKYTELSKHCLQAVVQLEEKAEIGSMNEVEKAISATDHFIERIKLSQEKAELPDQEVQNDNVVPIRNLTSVELQIDESAVLQNEVSDESDASTSNARVISYDALPDNHDNQESSSLFPAEIKHFFRLLMSVLSIFGHLLSKILKKIVSMMERIFMFLVAALVVLIVVFVVTYLSGSGFSTIGVL